MKSLIARTLAWTLVLTMHRFYCSSKDVVELNTENWHLVTKHEGLWLVVFQTSWCPHCQELKPELEKVATALKDVVMVGGVDATKQEQLAEEYGIREVPDIKIFGVEKNPRQYQGKQTAEAIVKNIMDTLQLLVQRKMGVPALGQGRLSEDFYGGEIQNDEVVLSDSNFGRMVLGSENIWMVLFFDPGCDHISLELEWVAATSEVMELTGGEVQLGAVDAVMNQELRGKYGTDGIPTILIFRKGKAVEVYAGERSRSHIVAFALKLFHAREHKTPLVQITNANVLHKGCHHKDQLCIIFMLPHIKDRGQQCRDTYLDMISKMARKYKTLKWGWMWTEGDAQKDLMGFLHIEKLDSLKVVALNLSKKLFSHLKDSFSVTALDKFLRDIKMQRLHPERIQVLGNTEEVTP